MIDKKFLQKLRQELLSYSQKRREVIKNAGDAQHLAKKAIFALQRDDVKTAKTVLREAEKRLLDLNKEFKNTPALFDEGSYKAALEEYTEAELFEQFLDGGPLSKIKNLPVDADAYVGGLCDVPGELCRYAVKSATEKKFDIVKRCHKAAEEIISELVDMDLTGYNRQKFDQAKQALHKLEQVVYEVSLRK